jgi:outer membrane murein-binding lipoprotein Lpp
MQLSTQKSRMHTKQTDEDTHKNLINQKNQEMNKYIQEIDILSTENDQLAADMAEVTIELEAAMEEIQRGNKELDALRRVVQDSDLRADELNDERDALRIKLEDLSDQVEKLQHEIYSNDKMYEKKSIKLIVL